MLDTILARIRGPKVPLGVTRVALRTPAESLGLSTPASSLQYHRPQQQLQQYSPRSGLRPPGR